MAKAFQHIIGGKEVHSDASFASRSSANLSDVVGTFPEATKEQVREACLVARQAFVTWREAPAPVRGELVGNIGKALEREKEALSRLVTREMGKTLKEARGSVQEAIDTCHFFQSEGRRLYGQTVPSEMRSKELMTYRRPLGVVAIVTAGNFPIAVPSWKIIPALVTGNTIVWKPSEDAPAVAYAFMKLMQEAGVPVGVVNVVFGGGRGAAGQYLVEMIDEGLVDKFAFTGSTAVGRYIGEVAGRNLQHPTLELGGKNPLVVMRDADLDNAVSGALWASFGTGGQRCTSAGNLIIDAPIYDDFKARFLEAAKKIKIGNPVKHEDVLYGPFINERFYERWLGHYDWGQSDGATLLYGEGRITPDNKPEGFVGDPDEGFYYHPTLVEGVTMDDDLYATETFGPIVGVARFSTFDEAMELANNHGYGLSSSIYTTNPLHAFRFRERITAGMVSVNNSTSGAEAHLPFGGNGKSGNGSRQSGVWVLDEFTRWQSMNWDYAGKLQKAQMDNEQIEGDMKFRLDEYGGVTP